MVRFSAGGPDGPAHGRRRVQGLDVLRAAAIVGVLVMHFSLREMTSRGLAPLPITSMLGYFGVELFFVLSGFLIGGILVDVADGQPGLRDWRIFMQRRWMRTLPLYFLWLAVLLVTEPPAADGTHMAMLYASFTQNLAWPMPQGWFSVSWSLSTEEWFYLLFSAVLLALAAFRVRGAVPLACALFVVLPLAARYLCVPAGAPFDTGMRQVALFRLDAIAYGVLVAWLHARWPDMLKSQKRALFLAGCVLLLAPGDVLALIGERELFRPLAPVLLSLTSIGFALWIPAFLDLRIPAPWLAAVVRRLSDWSYCLYVIHLTVIAFVWSEAGQLHLPMLLCTPAALLVSAALAELSRRFFEAPILRRRPQQPLRPRRAAGELRAVALPLQPAE